MRKVFGILILFLELSLLIYVVIDKTKKDSGFNNVHPVYFFLGIVGLVLAMYNTINNFILE